MAPSDEVLALGFNRRPIFRPIFFFFFLVSVRVIDRFSEFLRVSHDKGSLISSTQTRDI